MHDHVQNKTLSSQVLIDNS